MVAYAEYLYGIFSYVIFILIVLYLLMSPGPAGQGEGQASGATPEQDYSYKAYRSNRIYLKCIIETLPAYLIVIMVAIVLGVSPLWVDILTFVVLIARIEMLRMEMRNYWWGNWQPQSGYRSFLFVANWAGMAAMGIMILVAAY